MSNKPVAKIFRDSVGPFTLDFRIKVVSISNRLKPFLIIGFAFNDVVFVMHATKAFARSVLESKNVPKLSHFQSSKDNPTKSTTIEFPDKTDKRN